MKAKHAVLPLVFFTFFFLFLFCEYMLTCLIFGSISLASNLGRGMLVFLIPVPLTLGIIAAYRAHKFAANSEKIKLRYWIFLIATPIVLACYFSFNIVVGDVPFTELRIIYNLERRGSVDLADFIIRDFDFIAITDDGDYLSRYGFEDNIKSERWAQKINYYKNGKIIKRIILSTFVSEPENKFYLYFFDDDVGFEKFCLKAEKGNTVFSLKNKYRNGIAYFYCLENPTAEKIY